MSIQADRPQIPDRGLEFQHEKQTAAKREPRVSVDQEMPDLAAPRRPRPFRPAGRIIADVLCRTELAVLSC